MFTFDIVFNFVFLSVFAFQVLHFCVQYLTWRRIEYIYYSMFLLSEAVYFYIYISKPIFNHHVTPTAAHVYTAVEMSHTFIQMFFCSAGIIAYLNLNKSSGTIFTFYNRLKYISLVFIALLCTMHFLGIESIPLYYLIWLLLIPINFIMIYLLHKQHDKFATLIIWGTVVQIVGLCVTICLIIYQQQQNVLFAFSSHVPLQTALLIDLFILGYGLSLKAAESDKKLLLARIENQELLETERTRLARDLHDGLGGLLSSVKYSFSSIKESLTLTTPQQNNFEQTLQTLDTSIAEMRRIAHNMMPENLQQFGLNIALKDFCTTVQRGVNCHIHYESFGMNQYKANSTNDMALYRITQELINNALKHAAASQIIVQLQKDQQQLQLTVEDNGKGFDTALLKTATGAGWHSIESRVAFLKGKINITSTGKGTTVTIEIQN